VQFADDFSRDRVGNFPQRLELARGNLEIVESAGQRWVRSKSLEGEIGIPLSETQPQKFTMEFDFTFSENFPIEIYPAVKLPRRSSAAARRSRMSSWRPFRSACMPADAISSNRRLASVTNRGAAANQLLSEKRAQAIVAFLKSSYAVAADRLQAKGLGQTKPASSNDTLEGRQQNRRVELVKQ